jgi:hypothetical protein
VSTLVGPANFFRIDQIVNVHKQLFYVLTFALLHSNACQAGDIVYVEDLFGRDYVRAHSAVELSEKRVQLDEYATKSKLAVLREGGSDEIRFWISWANFDPDTIGYDTEGYVVSNQGFWICRVAYARKEHSPTGGTCKLSAKSTDVKAIFSNLEKLSKLSGRSLDCGVMDGEWMSVDGVFAGQRFTFSSSNPDTCPGEGSKLVAKVLANVR